jgi:hypothetical protein
MAQIAASAAKQKRIIEKTRRGAVGLEDCVFIGWFWFGAGRRWFGGSLPEPEIARFSFDQIFVTKSIFFANDVGFR